MGYYDCVLVDGRHDCRGDCGSVAVIDYRLLGKTTRTIQAYAMSPNMTSLCR